MVMGYPLISLFVLPGARIGVDGAISADAPGRVHESRELVLRIIQSLEEDVPSLAGLFEQVVRFDGLQN